MDDVSCSRGPWTLRLYPGQPRLGGYVRFFGRSTGALVRVHLLLFEHHHVARDSNTDVLLLSSCVLRRRHLCPPPPALHRRRRHVVIDLPPLLPLPLAQTETELPLRHLGVLLRGICAVVAVTPAGAIIVMLGLDIRRRVAYATVGDPQLSLCSAWMFGYLFARDQCRLSEASCVCRGGKSCADHKAYICRVDPPQPDSRRRRRG
jgi:hypothetical protein